MSNFIDLTGKIFERLLIIKRVDNNKWRQSCWLCRCSCGKEVIVCSGNLKSGQTKSCGCLKLKHGHTKNGKKTGLYRSWQNMIDRCTNTNNKHWKDYSGRGIIVCERWLRFENFLKDMPEWKPRLMLERRNNNKGYYKSNCYWATPKQQARNRRNNHLVLCFGKTQIIMKWSEETGIPAQTIQWRITHGWSPERALTEPVRKRKNNG